MSQEALRRSRGQAYQTVPSAATTGGNRGAQLWQVNTLCSAHSAHASGSSWRLLGLPALLSDSAAHKACLTLLLPSSEAASAQHHQNITWVLAGPWRSSSQLVTAEGPSAPYNLPDIAQHPQ